MVSTSRCSMSQESVFRLLRRERTDNFLEARIATKRVPIRVELEKAVAKGVRDTLYSRDLLNGAIFLASPSADLRQINSQRRAVDTVFGDGQQFARALTLF